MLVVVALIATGFSYLAWRFTRDDPVTYKDPEEHFKYGSTGGERESGIPYWIWKVLPKMFPEYLPGKTFTPGTEYASLGFLYEPGKDLPIGVSRRNTQGIDRVFLLRFVTLVPCVEARKASAPFTLACRRTLSISRRSSVLFSPVHQINVSTLHGSSLRWKGSARNMI